MTNATRSRVLFRSPGVQLALDGVRAAIAGPGCVLICGEPGTGRESAARAIHRATNGDPTPLEELLHRRADDGDLSAPFLVADCATERDIESRLFGRCAAVRGHDSLEITSTDGLLHRARGGTLFLGAAQDIPGRVQNRLARVLRDGELWLDDGAGSRLVAVEARVIASVDSSQACESESLVPELKKRLAVHQIEMPPLRHRREDLPGLVRLLMADICEVQQMPAKAVSAQAISLLCALPWRGNFTELRALLQTLVANLPGRMIRVADVLTSVRLDGADVSFSAGGTLKEARERFERDYVAAVIRQHHGRMAQAARVLGMQRTNLYRKVRHLAVTKTPPQAIRTSSHPVNVEEDSMEIR
jgi:two-component system nitrogen regulation response regulator NtrX